MRKEKEGFPFPVFTRTGSMGMTPAKQEFTGQAYGERENNRKEKTGFFISV
jgi:hypothetical protein